MPKEFSGLFAEDSEVTKDGTRSAQSSNMISSEPRSKTVQQPTPTNDKSRLCAAVSKPERDEERPSRINQTKAKLNLACDLCQIELRSQIALNQHLQGSKHRSKENKMGLSEQKSMGDKPAKVDPSSSKSSPLSNASVPLDEKCQFSCDLCQVELRSQIDLNQHLQGSKHRSKEEKRKLNEQNFNQLSSDRTRKSSVVASSLSSAAPFQSGSASPKSTKSETFNDQGAKKSASKLIFESAVAESSTDKQQMDVQYTTFCDLCNVDCGNSGAFFSHLEGSKHRKREKEALSPQAPQAAFSPQLPSSGTQSRNELTCNDFSPANLSGEGTVLKVDDIVESPSRDCSLPLEPKILRALSLQDTPPEQLHTVSDEDDIFQDCEWGPVSLSGPPLAQMESTSQPCSDSELKLDYGGDFINERPLGSGAISSELEWASSPASWFNQLFSDPTASVAPQSKENGTLALSYSASSKLQDSSIEALAEPQGLRGLASNPSPVQVSETRYPTAIETPPQPMLNNILPSTSPLVAPPPLPPNSSRSRTLESEHTREATSAVAVPIPIAPAGAWAKARPKIVPESASIPSLPHKPFKAPAGVISKPLPTSPPDRLSATRGLPVKGQTAHSIPAAPLETTSASVANPDTLLPVPLPAAATEAENNAAFDAMIQESAKAEADRNLEDTGALELVEKNQTELKVADMTYCGLYNPPRDGDCLLKCAMVHDFGSGGLTVTEDELVVAASDSTSPTSFAAKQDDKVIEPSQQSSNAVMGFNGGEKGNKGKGSTGKGSLGKGSTGKSGKGKGGKGVVNSPIDATFATAKTASNNGSGNNGNTDEWTVDKLRLHVVARVEAKAIASLEDKARMADAAANRATLNPSSRARAAVMVLRMRGPATAEVRASCEVMAKPGTVMGEDELQALADVRQACVEVRSVVCVQSSSDFGAVMPAKVYHPTPLSEGQLSVGKGDTLVLLHELRGARMSHYQLICYART